MDVYGNFVYCTLVAGILATDTVLSVDSTSRVPDPTLGEVWLTFDSTLAAGAFEIVRVVSKTPTTLTVLRAQEGTLAPATRPSGTVLRGALTKGILERIRAVPRTTVTYTTLALADGSSETGLVSLAKGYRLYALATSHPARVRLYDRTSKQAPDLTRQSGVDPAGDHGLMFDYVTAFGSLAGNLSPVVDGFDGDNPPDGQIPITVTNLNGSAVGALTVTMTYVRTE